MVAPAVRESKTTAEVKSAIEVVGEARASEFPNGCAGSTGRCNTGLKFTRRSFKAQSFARALIESQGYLVEVRLRVAG